MSKKIASITCCKIRLFSFKKVASLLRYTNLMKKHDGRNFQDTEDQLIKKERREHMVSKTCQEPIGRDLGRKGSARTILRNKGE
jgi:hypothetical protein